MDCTMTRFEKASFFIHMPRFDEGIAFFCAKLGFKQKYVQGNYTYLERDGVAIRMLGYDGANVPPQKGDRRVCYYIDVADVDALYDELKPALADMPKGDVHGPVTQTYGQRELMVLAPDNNLVVFGESKFIPADGRFA
jgi:catechol 2,3-dioxygenase-like lactoylglutathione lyase family enzyme